MQDQITPVPSTAFANRGQLYACITAVSIIHIYLAWRGEISTDIGIVGLGMQCLYFRVVIEFPKVVMKWYIATLLFAGLFINMWQWVLIIYNQHRRDEVETNFLFFTCVWLIPMVLFLSMDCSWELFGKKCETSELFVSASTLSAYESSFVGFLKRCLQPACDRGPVISARRRSLSLHIRTP
mmetsp:Transcript_27668/g.57573  ORF Transcript_27668/g.57573 Transcript_27668/m.57573 type:complete len:182 (-) Transcript_27668:113-658(-)